MESYTTKQVMAFLHVKAGAIRSLVKKGLLRQTKIANRNLYIANEVHSLLNKPEAKTDESK